MADSVNTGGQSSPLVGSMKAYVFLVGRAAVTRISGSDRYVVAGNMAKKGWYDDQASWAGLKHLVVACGETGKEADPLAAAGLAGVYDAPILLVKNSATLPSSTRNTITAVASANASITVHIVGGTASVPSGVATAIDRIAGVNNVTRDAGSDRYAVTANIAKRMVSVVGTTGPGSISGVLVICSENANAFYDALAASPIAYANHMPMLGVRVGSVPSSVRSVLASQFASVTERFAVSAPTYIRGSYAAAGCKGRLATSASRYTAATEIANQALAHGWLDPTDTGVAAKVPDALGGGAFMGNAGGVLLYTTSTSAMQSTTRTWITAKHGSIANGWVFGGTTSFPSAQETQFRGLLQ